MPETHGQHGSYGRFAAMIATSTAVMYGLMYLNTYALDHVFFSQTRMWMALLECPPFHRTGWLGLSAARNSRGERMAGAE